MKTLFDMGEVASVPAIKPNNLLMLIGCSKDKFPYVRDARRGGLVTPGELYSSQLFRKRVKHAEDRNVDWAVLSAKLGLWHSDCLKNPTDLFNDGEVYNTMITDLCPAERAAWNTSVAHHIVEWLWESYEIGVKDGPHNPQDFTVEIHAGRNYTETLEVILKAVGMNVVVPCRGMSIGMQLKYYTDFAM